MDLALAIKRQMIGVFADQHMRQQPGSGATALNGARWQLRLGEVVTARTGKAGPGDPVHDEAPRHVFQFFGHILAQTTQLAVAFGASIIAGGQFNVLARYMIRDRAAPGLAASVLQAIAPIWSLTIGHATMVANGNRPRTRSPLNTPTRISAGRGPDFSALPAIVADGFFTAGVCSGAPEFSSTGGKMSWGKICYPCKNRRLAAAPVPLNYGVLSRFRGRGLSSDAAVTVRRVALPRRISAGLTERMSLFTFFMLNILGI